MGQTARPDQRPLRSRPAQLTLAPSTLAPQHRGMLDFDEALARVLTSATPLGAERIPLWQASGRVLAHDVVAETPWPAFDHSAMDGYAVQSGDFSGEGPWTLPLVGESRTGHPHGSLEPRTTMRIFTGAALPPGADAVVMQENVEAAGALVRFSRAPRRDENVRRKGEDMQPGQVALAHGTRLTGFHLGLLAALDRAEILVSRRPRVTVLCTGDELRAPGSGGPPNSIPDSNGVALAALAEAAGASVVRAPLVQDEPQAMRDALAEALAASDLLLTVGGVSVGDHDVVRPALESLGVSIDFWKVRMKPGKPLVLARRERALVLGLPGNPVSAQVTFALFGMPLLRAMQGDGAPRAAMRRARLQHPLRQKPGRRGFHRAFVKADEVALLDNQASGAVTAMAWANALVVVPEEVSELGAGELVDVLSFADL